jgi:hypothetical protein
MFIVVVTYNSSHGEASCPVLVTKSIRKAVETARGVEKLGFQFYSKEVGAGVYRLEQGLSYPKKEFVWLEHQLPSRLVVFYCWPAEIASGRVTRWAEDWYDKELQAKVDNA